MIVDSTGVASVGHFEVLWRAHTCNGGRPRSDPFLVQHMADKVKEDEARNIRWLNRLSVCALVIIEVLDLRCSSIERAMSS